MQESMTDKENEGELAPSAPARLRQMVTVWTSFFSGRHRLPSLYSSMPGQPECQTCLSLLRKLRGLSETRQRPARRSTVAVLTRCLHLNAGVPQMQGPCAGLEPPVVEQQCSLRQPAWPIRLLLLDVRGTPPGSGTAWAAPPVSCPSRLQHTSPQRNSSSRFDPFAASDDALPGCTPLCAQQAGQAAAPPALHRKPAADASPAKEPRAAAVGLAAGGVKSCPPERAGRRVSRPLVRLRWVHAQVACWSWQHGEASLPTPAPWPPRARRVKRSLNGAVAAAAGPLSARRSLEAFGGAGGLPPQQLAGCSRKRIEAELVSPPMPRKSSRTLLDEQQAADMFTRLHLAPEQAISGNGGAAAISP